jgi:ubiquitin C-terminal hydrolase
MTFDISGACINPGKWIYNLYGISVHQGSARGGHYIAYTRRYNSWYYFSDSSWK